MRAWVAHNQVIYHWLHRTRVITWCLCDVSSGVESGQQCAAVRSQVAGPGTVYVLPGHSSSRAVVALG
jgi:hypothetical protein